MSNSNNILDFWPFPYKPRPNQVKALEWMADQDVPYILLEAPVGCHLAGTPILMYNGTTKHVENITISDVLMGPDNTPRHITELHTGKEQMYTISPTKGDSFVVNENHILSLITTPARRSGFDGSLVINISVKQYLATSNDFKRNTKLYRTTGIDFPTPSNELPISPYLLGVLLGDGSICNGQVGITTADTELLSEIQNQADAYNLTLNIQNQQAKVPTYYITTGNRGGDISTRVKNPLMEQLKDIGVYGTKSGTKFIPHSYKTGTREQRLQLLAGLIDTDGYYHDVFNITTKSITLADDIKFVARSLGFSANSFVRTVDGNEYTDITISGNLELIPTKLPRKQATKRKQKKRVTVTSFKVIPYGIDTYYGFEIDADNLYLLGDFTITHNSGKSNVGITYSHYLGNRTQKARGDSFILTPQRILQAQYEDSVKNNKQIDMASFYGKANYECRSKHTTCDIGSIIKPKCSNCPFTKAKIKAQEASDTVLNYKLALTSFAFTSTFKRRKLLVLDECHTLEQQLVDFDAFQITEHKCTRYKVPFMTHKSLPSALKWVKEIYLPNIQEACKQLEWDCEPLFDKPGNELTRREIRKIQELSSLQSHVDEAVEMSLRTIQMVQNSFVLVWNKTMFQFKRLTGEYSFNNIVRPFADKILFMSSTILNKDGFCEDLGIKEDEAAFISLSSEFSPANRPVVYMPQTKMNAKWKDPENADGRTRMLEAVHKISLLHGDDTGIIHTGNFEIAKWLVENLNVSQRIYHHNPDSGDDRNSVIAAFQGDPKPALLISPSSTEGLDLKDDLGRFAIFCKIPFGYLGDQWIKRRMELSSEWYQRRAMIDVIQGSGRVVRSSEDWGQIYILDQSWAFLYKSAQRMIPRWWKDGYSVL